MGGVSLALPLLEYTHGNAWAADDTTLRFLTVFSHGGTISNQAGNMTNEYGVPARHNGMGNVYDDNHHGVDWWRPIDPGESLVLGPIHEPLEPWRSKLLVIEGVDNLAAVNQDPYGRGDHGISNVTCLTAADLEVVVEGEETYQVALGPSIDQVIAERLAARQAVPFDRIHLTVAGHQYGSPFFRASQQRAGGEVSPAAAWLTLFEGVDPNPEPDPEFLLLQARRGSVLDDLIGQYERFKGTVSSRDLQVIEAHLDHLRSLEQEVGNYVACAPPPSTSIECDGYGGCSDGATPETTGPLFAEMIVAAIRCGLTNVANLEIADILTPWTTAGLQVNSEFGIGHSLGHYSMDVGQGGLYEAQKDAWLAEMLDNRRWRVGLMGKILEGLDDPTFLEGDKTILDNSLVYYTSEFRTANHIASNTMALVAGSAGGYFQTGRFVDYNQYKNEGLDTYNYESSESVHNLFTSFLQAMGESDTHFGNDDYRHQGPLPGL
jgi:hypothetical protein